MRHARRRGRVRCQCEVWARPCRSRHPTAITSTKVPTATRHRPATSTSRTATVLASQAVIPNAHPRPRGSNGRRRVRSTVTSWWGLWTHQDRREIDPGQGLVTVDHHDQHRIQRRGDRRGHRPRCRGHRPDHSARGLCLRQRCRGGGLPTRRSAILTGINEEPHRRGGHRRNQTTPPEPQSNTPGAVGDPDTASWILDTESPKFPTPYSSLSNPMASLRRMNWRTEVATMGRGRFGIREVDIRYCHDLALFAEEVVPQFSVTEATFQARCSSRSRRWLSRVIVGFAV